MTRKRAAKLMMSDGWSRDEARMFLKENKGNQNAEIYLMSNSMMRHFKEAVIQLSKMCEGFHDQFDSLKKSLKECDENG